MARTPLRNLRVNDETWARWMAEAHERGYKLSEFIRLCVEHHAFADRDMDEPKTLRKEDC